MTEHPRYQGTDENVDASARLTARQRRARVALIAIVVAFVLPLVILHVTGVVGKDTGF